jgi:Tol biopolymer transport system component
VAAYSPVTGKAVLAWSYALNSDAQFIAFSTEAQVTSVVSSWEQVYLRDRATNRFELLSVGPRGAPANGHCGVVSINADGRFVLMYCEHATNLIAGDSLPAGLVLRDRESGTNQRVAAGAAREFAGLSADGRYVVFDTGDALAAGDRNAFWDVYLWDRQTLVTELVSVGYGAGAPNGDSLIPSVSYDGRFVAFESRATNLVPGDTNDSGDIFVRDRLSKQTRRVSLNSTGGQANNESFYPVINALGTVVAFTSRATNLVGGDTNGHHDVFAHELSTGKTERINVSTGGRQSHSGAPSRSSISGNGRYVAFADLGRLATNDENAMWDIFVRDRQARTTVMVSVSSSGEQANGFVGGPVLSLQGDEVLFDSRSSNLTTMPFDSYGTVYVHQFAVMAPSPITVSPVTVKFGTVRVGRVSTSQAVTITNTSRRAVPVAAIALGGPSPGQFLRVDRCPAELAAGASCIVAVQFAPNGTGATTAKLIVNLRDDLPKSYIWLNGTGE